MLRRLKQFFATEAAGGAVMLAASMLALILVNSHYQPRYEQLLHWPVMRGISFSHFVTDMLMPIFFLMIGIELKHEMTHGALMTWSQKTLPLIAALGGVIMPAVIYLLINIDSPTTKDGWAIPTATDIAFAICVLNLVGRHISATAKIFLLAIAIYDDLIAIAVIAIFFNHGGSLWALLGAFACICVFIQFRRWKVRHAIDYLMIGLLMSIMLHYAGIHTTVAGMVTGLCMPRDNAERMMGWLHPLVSFSILPVFAFVSAGVSLSNGSLAMFVHPITLGIVAGLVLGKQIGIFGATWLTVKLRLAPKPLAAKWSEIYAVSVLAGIGFTMSLLIGQLAFAKQPDMQAVVKIGILLASMIAALAAIMVIKMTCRGVRRSA